MRFRTYKTECIVLKRYNVGEADRILTVFTKYNGKLRCLARGVRKPSSRKAASIELFNRTALFLARGKNLDIVTQAQIIESFSDIRKNLKSLKAAFHVIELVDILTAENQENQQIYENLVKILNSISTSQQATQKQINEFEKSLLSELGFGLPQDLSLKGLRKHIEAIVEKKLKSAEIFA